MQRIIRAFFQAVKMTLRGEQIPLRPHAGLWAWIEEGEQLTNALFALTDRHKLDRNNLTKRIEGREMSLETALGGVRYHLSEEYPYLLRHLTAHSVTAIYASNMNDQYFVSSYIDLIENAEVKQALQNLDQHLQNIPPETDQNQT